MIKCLLGHKWKTKGFARVEIYDLYNNGLPIQAYDSFVFVCRCCGKMKETKLSFCYQYFEADQQQEVHIERKNERK